MFAGNSADHVVTIVFTPPHGGPRNVIALAADCSAVESARQTCAARSDVASAHCVSSSDLALLDALHLRFRFPDTDAFVRDPNDGIELSGPATLAVTRVGDPLPCELAS